METKTTQQIQVRTNSSNLPTIGGAESLAAIRLDEKRYPHYRNIPRPNRIEWMSGEVKTLAEIARTKDFGGKEAIMTASVLDEMISQDRYMADLTLPEIHDAFKNGVFGLYGEFYGISAPNLYGFLGDFLNSEKKMEASKMVLKTKEQMLAERSRREREEQQKRITAEIEEAKRNGFVPDRHWWKPKPVDDAPSSEEHRNIIARQAEAIMRGEIK